MNVEAASSNVVLSDGSIDPLADSPVRLSSCLPTLAIGLTAPAALMLMIDPAIASRLASVLPGLLLPFLLVTIAICIYCVLVPGKVAAVLSDASERTLTLIETNLFARRRTVLPFGDIAGVVLANAYDRDGYATRRAELVLRSGERMPLPEWIDETAAASLEAAIAAGRRKR